MPKTIQQIKKPLDVSKKKIQKRKNPADLLRKQMLKIIEGDRKHEENRNKYEESWKKQMRRALVTYDKRSLRYKGRQLPIYDVKAFRSRENMKDELYSLKKLIMDTGYLLNIDVEDLLDTYKGIRKRLDDWGQPIPKRKKAPESDIFKELYIEDLKNKIVQADMEAKAIFGRINRPPDTPIPPVQPDYTLCFLPRQTTIIPNQPIAAFNPLFGSLQQYLEAPTELSQQAPPIRPRDITEPMPPFQPWPITATRTTVQPATRDLAAPMPAPVVRTTQQERATITKKEIVSRMYNSLRGCKLYSEQGDFYNIYGDLVDHPELYTQITPNDREEINKCAKWMDRRYIWDGLPKQLKFLSPRSCKNKELTLRGERGKVIAAKMCASLSGVENGQHANVVILYKQFGIVPRKHRIPNLEVEVVDTVDVIDPYGEHLQRRDGIALHEDDGFFVYKKLKRIDLRRVKDGISIQCYLEKI